MPILPSPHLRELCFSGPQEQSDWSENDILGAIQKLVSGRTADLQDMHLSPDTHFYILGLAPNAARLSVRFFWQDTFTKLAKNVNAHYERLEITRPAYEKFDTLWPYTLARSAVRFSKDWKKADEELQKSFPRLSGDLLTSILNDTRYPATLLNGHRAAHPRRARCHLGARVRHKSLLF